MHVIEARNVEEALPIGLRYLLQFGDKESSRNGMVLVAPGPVATVYRYPEERVLLWPERDCNPFFHLMEALWMLAGRRDVEFPAYFAGQIKEYSDDGAALNGAYGFRWRYHFGMDQIRGVVELLKKDMGSRRAVIQMYDPIHDSDGGKDVPCNTVIYFRVNRYLLDMTVSCRSNDVVWGAYGANAVHFSILQEFIADQLGIPVGTYTQISNNFHIYERHWDLMDARPPRPDSYPPSYLLGFGGDYDSVIKEITSFVVEPSNYESKLPFLHDVARPMFKAWEARKNKVGDGLKELATAPLCDWTIAATQWIDRRNKA
jgi:thymidylate synthase